MRFLITTTWLLSFAVAAFADPPPPPPKKNNLQQFVVDALTQAFNGLQVGPAQKAVFEAEALLDASAFVSNYKGHGESTDVQIDKEKLRNYLKFSASSYYAAGSEPHLCLRVRAPVADCAPCEGMVKALQENLSARFTKRGFAVKPGPGISDESELTGANAFEELVARGSEARCDGVVYGEVTPERSADADEGDDEMKVQWAAYLMLRDLSSRKIRAQAQSNGQLPREISSESAARQYATLLAGRATTDLFASAGAQAVSGAGVKMAAEQDERYLRLEGVNSFASYVKFKQIVMSNMPELGLEERFISPGAFQFTVAGGTEMVQVGQKLKALPWGGQTLQIVRDSQDELAVVLK